MFTYLVTSYQNPAQTYRLLNRLRRWSPASRLVVSHDQKGPALDRSVLAEIDAELFLTPTPVNWGDGTYLQSVLAALERLGRPEPGDWVTVLTAQDYPIRPLREYEGFLASSGCDMVLEEPPPSAELDVLQRRYVRRLLPLPRLVRRSRLAVRASAAAARRIPGVDWAPQPHGAPDCIEIPRLRTPFHEGLRLYKGADLFALGAPAVETLLAQDGSLLAYFSRSPIPSEAYYHTVLRNSALVNCPGMLHFAEWDESAHPRLLDDEDAEWLMRQPYWFARKFSPDASVLDRLDALLGPRDR